MANENSNSEEQKNEIRWENSKLTNNEITSIAEKLLSNRNNHDQNSLEYEMAEYEPQDTEMILTEAIKIGVKNNSNIELSGLKRAIKPEILKNIYSNILNDYALNNNKDLKGIAKHAGSTALMEVVKSYVDTNNKTAIARALDVCSNDVIKKAILAFAKDKNEAAIKLLNEVINESDDVSLKESFQENCHKAITEYAINKNQDLISLAPYASLDTVTDIMVDYLDKNNDKAFKNVEKLCKPEYLKNVRGNALYHFAINEKFIMQNLAKEASTNAFANALKKCTIDKNDSALARVLTVCPNENKQKAIFEMVMTTFLKPKGNENFQFLSDNCPAKFKNEVLHEVENPSILTKLKRLGKKVKNRSGARRPNNNNNNNRRNSTPRRSN